MSWLRTIWPKTFCRDEYRRKRVSGRALRRRWNRQTYGWPEAWISGRMPAKSRIESTVHDLLVRTDVVCV